MHTKPTPGLSHLSNTFRLDNVCRAGGCEQPIRLRGTITRFDPATDRTSIWSTDQLPGGVAYAACKSRRASRCQPCSRLYQGDAFQLIAAGLRGGKGVSETVHQMPALFVTLTAPSFGPVHRVSDNEYCRRRAPGDLCEHGMSLACWKKHSGDDEIAGQPICPDCFNYEAAVMWNAQVGQLWRFTRITIDRRLARLAGLTQDSFRQLCSTQYVKVAEFQKRGLVHFHTVIRVSAPPEVLDAEDVANAIRAAVSSVTVSSADGHRIGWGQQLDVVKVADGSDGSSLSRPQVAGYLAKYATKGTDASGVMDRRVTEEDLDYIPTKEHLLRLARTAWETQRRFPELNTGAWAHQLGFRGHFCTKSRSWSTTFLALRLARREHHRAEDPAPVTISASWQFVGSGYRTAFEELVASALRTQRLERRPA